MRLIKHDQFMLTPDVVAMQSWNHCISAVKNQELASGFATRAPCTYLVFPTLDGPDNTKHVNRSGGFICI